MLVEGLHTLAVRCIPTEKSPMGSGQVVHLAGRVVTVVIVIEPPEGMQKEEYEEWMFIDKDIPVAATLTDLEICQAIKVDDSDGDESIIK
ncbi:hypothetical protein AVEN_44862-1 [Araneus ventricosus]|uniref:Uncharacterized protein n=1 Tax=Araneus ventricosus TaxID=182803 RepID=A0A4Y2T4L6_ARAVE|nr:hypothetical protein AVEN_44862-1 [Araneus ventricosus]